jgi:hypothetical protein
VIATVVDRNGQPVKVGTRVRVLEIAAFLKRDLPLEEVEELATMVGEVFEVYEIDESGGACVEKVWYEPGGQRSHSLSLEAHEMEVA